MVKHVPKVTYINKIRRFFVLKRGKVNNVSKYYFFNMVAFKLSKLFFSCIGIMALQNRIVFFKELFAMEKQLKKLFPKKIKLLMKVPLVNSFTEKSLGVRMGKGKGVHKKYYGVVLKNMVFLEIIYNKVMWRDLYKNIVNEGISKLSFKAKIKLLKY